MIGLAPIRLIPSDQAMSFSMLAVLGGLMGAVLGSFIATLVIRWPMSAVAGRSRCDICHLPIGTARLIPLLSYGVQQGRSSCCGQPISWLHPASELLGLTIGVLSFSLGGWEAWPAALLGWTLLALALFDLRHMILPDWLTSLLAVSGLASGLIEPQTLIDRFAGLACGYVSLATISLIYRRLRHRAGLGGGDIKLFAAIGAWLGWQSLPLVLLLSGALGFLSAIIMQLTGHEVKPTTRLPLGTLMAAAAWPLYLVAH